MRHLLERDFGELVSQGVPVYDIFPEYSIIMAS
jgi:hypothetical protein